MNKKYKRKKKKKKHCGIGKRKTDALWDTFVLLQSHNASNLWYFAIWNKHYWHHMQYMQGEIKYILSLVYQLFSCIDVLSNI